MIRDLDMVMLFSADVDMPAQQFAWMTDDELKALWAYRLTVEAKPVGNR